MKTKSLFSILSILILSAFVGAPVGLAQEKQPKQDGEKTTKSDEDAGKNEAADEPKEETDAEKAEPKKQLAIVGGDIYTVTGEVIRGGSILIEDGKIKEVGQAVEIPEGVETIDATGQVITPGFVAINMSGVGVRSAPQNNDKLEDALDPFDRNLKYSLGVGITSGCIELSQGGGRGRRRRAPEDQNGTVEPGIEEQWDQDQNGEIDSTNGDTEVVVEPALVENTRREGEQEEKFLGIDPNLEEFVTEAQLDYGIENTSLCPCCGLPILPTEPITATPPTEAQPRKHAVIKMSYGILDSMLMKEDVFYSPAPGALTGALNRHNWRRDVKKAQAELKKADDGEKTEDQKETKTPTDPREAMRQRILAARSGRGGGGASNALAPLVKKEVAMRVTANSVDEIRDMISLAEELDYELIIEGGVEAWVVASALSEARVPVIYTPRQRRSSRPGEEATSGSSIESTGIFQEMGISFATATLGNSISMGGLAGRDLTSLPLEAAFAVRGGASNRTALESLTIVPAKMLGLEDRIGSIEVGKDADLLIMNGEPLDYRTYVETAIVSGDVCYERAKDKVYPVYDRD